MTLIPVEEDGRTISARFRKAPKFAFLHEGQVVVSDNARRTAKSDAFFEYFDTLDIRTLYVKNLGLRTYRALQKRGIEVYRIDDSVTRVNRITPQSLTRIDEADAQTLCTLGHQRKDI